MLPALGAQAAVVLTTLHSFGVCTNGANPYGGLVQGSDGNFYGTTGYGGTNNAGTVFKISTTGALSSLYSFTGGNDGSGPVAGLVQGRDGYLYGTTGGGAKGGGGKNGCGTVFKISTDGALTSLYSFTGGNDGSGPLAGLVRGSDGNFYGTTCYGGAWPGQNGQGTVFKISTNGALATLYSFTGGSDGAHPFAAMVQGSDGNFYGTTCYGGTWPGQNGQGTVFKISPNGVLTSLHSFTGGNDGGYPFAGLVQSSDGNFYGTTYYGGRSGDNGTVFKISPDGALTSLYSFTGGNDGRSPRSGLVQGHDGYFYGTTAGGGTNYAGTVFKISPNGALTGWYSFTGGNDGSGPLAGLVQGSGGYFYGMTPNGGANGDNGTVFEVSSNGALTTLYSFTGCNDGENPEAGLLQGSDGNFYGTTSAGGDPNYNRDWGTVFEISTNGALTLQRHLALAPAAGVR